MMTKKIAVLLISGLVIVSLAGCAGGTSTASPQSTEPAAQPSSGTTLMGKVASVSGNTITLDLIALNNPPSGGNAPGGNNGQSPGTSPNASANPSGSNSGGKWNGGSGQQNGGGPGAPNGQKGGRPNGGGAFNMTPTGETKTITVTTGTAITVGNRGSTAAGAIADIKTGDILRVTMDGDTVKAIVVSNFGAGQPQSGQSGSQNSSSPDVQNGNQGAGTSA